MERCLLGHNTVVAPAATAPAVVIVFRTATSRVTDPVVVDFVITAGPAVASGCQVVRLVRAAAAAVVEAVRGARHPDSRLWCRVACRVVRRVGRRVARRVARRAFRDEEALATICVVTSVTPLCAAGAVAVLAVRGVVRVLLRRVARHTPPTAEVTAPETVLASRAVICARLAVVLGRHEE